MSASPVRLSIVDERRLGALLDQVAALAGRPREIAELSGGLTNRNLKVTTPDGVFVARCFEPAGSLLGIDREREYHNTKAAEASGAGAPVVDYRPDLGLLVIGFIDGRTYSNDDLRTPGAIPRVAAAVRLLHGGPRFDGDFDMFQLQPGYRATVRSGGYRLPAGYDEHAAAFDDARRALAARPIPAVPCNNDLLAGNMIDDGSRIWLIDYEYSGNNDPCFELGNIWSECGLAVDQLEELVTSYYGAPRRSMTARARVQGVVAKYGWTLWGCIQHATSEIEFDFWPWAMEKYDGAVAEFSGPDWETLLLDLQRED